MTHNQLTEIRNYLLSKKLPLDVLLEVQDHFANQITDLEKEENLNFEEAFLKTKLIWQKELAPVRKSFFSFQKVPKIVKTIHNKTAKNIFKKSFNISLILLFILFFTATIFNKDYFFEFNIIISFILLLMSIFMFIYYVFSRIDKKRTVVEDFFYTVLWQMFLVYLFFDTIGFFTKIPTNNFKVVYNFINVKNSYSLDIFILAVVQLCLIYTVFFYIFFMFKERANAIKNIKKIIFTTN